VQLLAGQADQHAAGRIDGEGVVALVAPPAAVADLPRGAEGGLPGVVQLGGVVDDEQGPPALPHALPGKFAVGPQGGGVGDVGVVEQPQGGAVGGRVVEFLGGGAVGVAGDAGGGLDQAPGAPAVPPLAAAQV
jgi:hypothetical protein